MKIRWYIVLCLVLAGCTSSAETVATSATTPTTLPPSTAIGTTTTVTAVPTPLVAAAAPTNSPTALPASPTALPPSPTAAPTSTPAIPIWSYPIGSPGQPLGNGFFIRHGYAVENTWFNPGYWHTGEDWYALEGDTAGANVFAVAAGEVVYTGANYPGRVVIIQHADDLFSMYGHLDPALTVEVGKQVERGALLGRVLRRTDDVPNHLHFEIRTFLTTSAVNGQSPRYAFRCGPGCPPGPGYWPIQAPELPSALGWRNPTHALAQRMYQPEQQASLGEVVVATEPVSPSLTLWTTISSSGDPSEPMDDIQLRPGDRFPLLAVSAGPEQSETTSALGYLLWYKIGLDDGRSGWAQAAIATNFEVGSDGRVATIRFNLYPATESQP